MEISFIVYAVATFMVAVFLSAKTDRKFLSFVLTYWILAQPVLGHGLTIPLLGVQFDVTPNRILLFALLGYSLLSVMSGNNRVRNQVASSARPPFEKYLYLYLPVVFLSLAFNYGHIRTQDIVTEPLEIVIFIVVYLVIKNFATLKVVESIIKAILVLAITGAIIAYIQFAVNSSFLRTGETPVAFGTVMRATGIFTEEYDFGAFQDLGVMIAILRYRGFLRYVLVPVLAMSVVLTFHRLDIIVLGVCLIAYFWLYINAAHRVFASIMMILALVVASAATPIIGSMIGKSTVVTTMEGRLGQDTITGRLAQYEVVAATIFTDYTLLGMGTYYNPAYDKLMKEHGMVNYASDGMTLIGFRVHNGYLEVGILNGVIAMFLFIAFLFSMVRFFKKNSSRESLNAAIPVFAVLIMMLINLSNGMSSFNIYYSLLCAMLSGAFVAYRRMHVSEVMGAQANGARITVGK